MTTSKQPTLSGYKALTYWLEHLPFGEQGRAMQTICTTLQRLREESMPHVRWFALLERFHLPIDTTMMSTRLEILHAAVGVDEKCRRSQAINQLQQELANGYAQLVYSAPLAGRSSLVALAAYRVLYHLGELQKWCYQLYCPVPSGLWATLHAVHDKLQQLRLTNYPVIFPHSTESCTTLEEMYKQLLLLGIANTSRLPTTDISVVSQCVTAWSPHALLTQWDGTESAYVLDAHSDQAPLWLTGGSAGHNDASLQQVVLTGLNTQLLTLVDLLDDVAESEIELEGKVLSRQVLQRLLQVWHSKPVRQQPRVSQSGTLALHFDLDATWREHTQVEWHIVNASATGYCLANPNTLPADLHVGQWLKVQAGIQDKPWHMGVIRWAQQQSQHGMQLGIQVLPDTCVMTDARLADAKQAVPAWLLQAEDATAAPTLLVTSRCKVGDQLELDYHGQPTRMRLGAQVDRGEVYSRFALHATG